MGRRGEGERGWGRAVKGAVRKNQAASDFSVLPWPSDLRSLDGSVNFDTFGVSASCSAYFQATSHQWF